MKLLTNEKSLQIPLLLWAFFWIEDYIIDYNLFFIFYFDLIKGLYIIKK
jgi:hypothetical protein